jgi:2,5-diamino-6-(ribosylamino)-4(3H)-pyrimidinone 5'-phosphate reductase
MKRPYIIVNCAISVDGKISLPSKRQLRISSVEDIKRMYELRNECDAVLVGIDTVISDNPKLTVKSKYVKNPKQPIRIVLDSRCRIPKDSLVLNNVTKTIIISLIGKEKNFTKNNIESIGCRSNDVGNIDLKYALEILYKKDIKKMLVEGGGTVIWSFLREKLVDELYVFIGPLIIGGKDTPTLADGDGIKNENELIRLEIQDIKRLGDGILTHYKMVR